MSPTSFQTAPPRGEKRHATSNLLTPTNSQASKSHASAARPDGPHTSMTHEMVQRITSRQRTKLITVRPDSLTIEVTDYKHFTDFRDLLQQASAATEQVVQPDGIVRAGLRYIDEVVVPTIPPDWSQWIDSSLLPPSSDGLVPSEWTGTVMYKVDDEQLLVFRYGPSASPVVSSTEHLRRPKMPTGPVFMLDFDSSWQPSEIPTFTAERIVTAADRLRAPLRGLFDSLIKPDLLKIFRKQSNA